MVKASVVVVAWVIAGCLLFAPPALATETTKGPLVDVAWLARNLGAADLVVLDASSAASHKKEHIPGAISADAMSYGALDQPVERMERQFQAWGLSPGRKVLIYDQGGTFMATRLHYDLVYHGYPPGDLLVLDGGLAKWRASGGALTAEPTAAPPKGTFRVARRDESVRVLLPEVLNASGDPAKHALIEALGPSWHFGEAAFFDRAGHIPNGIMLPPEDFFAADMTFKPRDEIARMLRYHGVHPGQTIHTYCGGGLAATVPFFALKYLLDYPDVRVFQESQLGWLRDDRGLPFWTYDAPLAMRETAWLRTWGGKMLRGFGVSQLSVVDVRSAEAHGQGHVPFALSVPADVFRRHFREPERLAEALARAGVDAMHEAVVVGDAGLAPDTALAYVALERLGQKRVSVFMDSLVRWAELGQEVTRDATKVGAPKAYAARPRAGTVVADANATQGVYPKVLVASGAKVPANAPQGKVVHVPWTDLVDAGGRPKPAKDLWNLLTKAGVPRYAELVTFADDPGEAAATYYVLKLMGYPDVKVLVP